MTSRIGLIHPIYLDVPMLVSFAAAVEGGVAFEREVTNEHSSTNSGTAHVSAKFGLSSLFSSVFDASANASIEESRSTVDKSLTTESRGHTEASMAILLYHRLAEDLNSIVKPKTHNELSALEPGALIEITGVLKKNAVDSVIDYIDTIDIMRGLATVPSSGAELRQSAKKPKTNAPQLGLQQIRKTLDDDRKRTPISNTLVDCTQPDSCAAVVTLRTENLRDLTLSELHKNTV